MALTVLIVSNKMDKSVKKKVNVPVLNMNNISSLISFVRAFSFLYIISSYKKNEFYFSIFVYKNNYSKIIKYSYLVCRLGINTVY